MWKYVKAYALWAVVQVIALLWGMMMVDDPEGTFLPGLLFVIGWPPFFLLTVPSKNRRKKWLHLLAATVALLVLWYPVIILLGFLQFIAGVFGLLGIWLHFLAAFYPYAVWQIQRDAEIRRHLRGVIMAVSLFGLWYCVLCGAYYVYPWYTQISGCTPLSREAFFLPVGVALIGFVVTITALGVLGILGRFSPKREEDTILEVEVEVEAATPKRFPKKRVAALVCVLAALWFTQCPTFFVRITPESHYITAPGLPSGRGVDYVRAMEDSYTDMLQNPEENGFRHVLQTVGPWVLSRGHLWGREHIPWEELPTQRVSKRWWANTWVPICEKLHLDPNRKPPGYDVPDPDFGVFIQKNGIRGDEPFLVEELEDEPAEVLDYRVSEDDADAYREKLENAPWDPAENPRAAAWLEARAAWFDAYARGVASPVFVCYYPPSGCDDGDTPMLCCTFLPDLSGHQEFAKMLRMRINAAIFTCEIDAAIDDILTLYRLGRHQGTGAKFLVLRLAGAKFETLASRAVAVLLDSGKATDAQLVRLDAGIRALPPATPRETLFDTEMLGVHELVQLFFRLDPQVTRWTNTPRWAPLLANENLTRAHFREYVRTGREAFLETDPQARNEKLEAWNSALKSEWDGVKWWDFVEIRGRSRLAANRLAGTWFPALTDATARLESNAALTSLTHIAIAVERFRLQNGALPATLDALAPDFLPEKPLDRCTHRDTLVYRVREDGTFRLYSLGVNLRDDGADAEKWADVVFGPSALE